MSPNTIKSQRVYTSHTHICLLVSSGEKKSLVCQVVHVPFFGNSHKPESVINSVIFFVSLSRLGKLGTMTSGRQWYILPHTGFAFPQWQSPANILSASRPSVQFGAFFLQLWDSSEGFWWSWAFAWCGMKCMFFQRCPVEMSPQCPQRWSTCWHWGLSCLAT